MAFAQRLDEGPFTHVTDDADRSRGQSCRMVDERACARSDDLGVSRREGGVVVGNPEALRFVVEDEEAFKVRSVEELNLGGFDRIGTGVE